MTPDQLARVRKLTEIPGATERQFQAMLSLGEMNDLEAVLARLDTLEGMAESSSRYEHELTRAAELLQGAIVIGKVKAIGLLEVAAAVQALIDERAEFVGLVREMRRAKKALAEFTYSGGTGNVGDFIMAAHKAEQAVDAALAELDKGGESA